MSNDGGPTPPLSTANNINFLIHIITEWFFFWEWRPENVRQTTRRFRVQSVEVCMSALLSWEIDTDSDKFRATRFQGLWIGFSVFLLQVSTS